MINLIVIAPLAISGLIGALYREHKYKKRQTLLLADEHLSKALKLSTSTTENIFPEVVDDAVELTHYQQSSLTGLALSTSLSLFYSPLLVVTIPFLAYNTFYLVKSIQRTTKTDKFIPAINIFELTNLGLTLLTKHYVWSSLLLFISFNLRRLRLKLLNTTHIGFKEALNSQSHTVWVLRDEIEVETPLSELQKHDILAIHQGEIIPVEGVVTEGLAKVEQFSLTGTIQTVTKQTDDIVFAFTRVETGKLHIRYT